jgi:hypothetical protein
VEIYASIKLLVWIFVSQIMGVHGTRISDVDRLLRSGKYRERSAIRLLRQVQTLVGVDGRNHTGLLAAVPRLKTR